MQHAPLHPVVWVGQTFLIFPLIETGLMPFRLHPERVAAHSISTIPSLCRALDITIDELQSATLLDADERYTEGSVPKKDGSARAVYNPNYQIRKIQRRINRRIFANSDVVAWPDHIFGSVPNSDAKSGHVLAKDYVSCARQHCGAKSILSIDIKDFFNNIHYDTVFDVFNGFLSYPTDVARVLANICCRDGSIVQGALTSSYIASLCLYRVEGNVVNRLLQKGLTYTRLVDDITVSSKVVGYDFHYARAQVEKMLLESDLPINLGKTKLQHASMLPLIVHGLRVDFSEPRLPPAEPSRIRAAVKRLELLAAAPGYRASRGYRKDFNSCMGRVNKLQRVGHAQHEPLVERLRQILPLPSHKDIERAQLAVARLERDHLKPGYVNTYWFHRRYYYASEKLSILHRSFPRVTLALRGRLGKIRPPAKRYE